MNDIIKKAVELADGWEYEGKQETMAGTTASFVRVPVGFLSVSWNSFIERPAYLDALAAQLVRQVDVSHYLVCYEHETVIQSIGEDGLLDDPCNPVGRATGQARTMNTIKAIVDSGVLE